MRSALALICWTNLRACIRIPSSSAVIEHSLAAVPDSAYWQYQQCRVSRQGSSVAATPFAKCLRTAPTHVRHRCKDSWSRCYLEHGTRGQDEREQRPNPKSMHQSGKSTQPRHHDDGFGWSALCCERDEKTEVDLLVSFSLERASTLPEEDNSSRALPLPSSSSFPVCRAWPSGLGFCLLLRAIPDRGLRNRTCPTPAAPHRLSKSAR